MSDFQVCRIKGGYRIHRKVTGERVALCGAKPGISKARHMKDRTGWWVWKEGDFKFPYPLGHIHDSRCKICFKQPE